jgi:hypothetical protein
MLLQAKAPTTAAEWAQAYAGLAKEKDAQLAALTKEKDALVKEKDALVNERDDLTSVTKEKDAQLAALTKEKDALAKEKDALAKQLSECNAIGNSTGLLGAFVALVCETLSRLSAHSFCARRCTCDVCSCSGGRRRSRDATETSSRSRCRAPPRLDTAPF